MPSPRAAHIVAKVALAMLALSLAASRALATPPYLGEIRLVRVVAPEHSLPPAADTFAQVAFQFAPLGWALCQGQILDIDQNNALWVTSPFDTSLAKPLLPRLTPAPSFSLIGTYYGFVPHASPRADRRAH